MIRSRAAKRPVGWVIADTLGMGAAIAGIGLLTIASGVLVVLRMPETLRL